MAVLRQTLDADELLRGIEAVNILDRQLQDRTSAVCFYPPALRSGFVPLQRMQSQVSLGSVAELNLVCEQMHNRLLSLEERLATASSTFDERPPSPATIRGRLGAILVRLANRFNWWHRRQVSEFALAVNSTVAEHGEVLGHILGLVASTQAQAADQNSRAERLITGLQKRVRELEGKAQSSSGDSADLIAINQQTEMRRFDDLYFSFEGVFRGTREEIKSRHAVYVPELRTSGCISPITPVLDLGCGRGEWLELLRDSGLPATGVDSSPAMLRTCRKFGLAVVEGDAATYVSRLPSDTLGAVTAFHLIEHLPFDRVLDLVREALRVLVPGGTLILETPNPRNLLVGACTFYLDPTHHRPLPSQALVHFVQSVGFGDCRVLELHPNLTAPALPSGDPLLAEVHHLLYGPQDYGVIARKSVQ